jgi:uncharacterized membrane protein YtjA (UPF0391 family)
LERILPQPAVKFTETVSGGSRMNILLIVAIVLILLALLGFGGVFSALRSAAWLILVIGIVVLVLSLIF